MPIYLKGSSAPLPAEKIPAGVYPAELTEIKQFQNHYGERLGWIFTLNDGRHIMRSTGLNISPNSKTAPMIQALAGEAITPDQMAETDLETLVRKPCRLVISIGKNQSGKTYSNIEAVLPPEPARKSA